MGFSPDWPLILNERDAETVLAVFPEMQPLILIADLVPAREEGRDGLGG